MTRSTERRVRNLEEAMNPKCRAVHVEVFVGDDVDEKVQQSGANPGDVIFVVQRSRTAPSDANDWDEE